MEIETTKVFVPGRLCLFGEHSDWAGEYCRQDASIKEGYCIAIGTHQGIYATCQPHSDKLIMASILANDEVIGPREMDMTEDSLFREAKKGRFFSYAAGVAYCLMKERGVGGMVIHNRMDLPIKRGLSSSAAIGVLTARAFNQLYDLKLTKREEMEYAYLGEIFTGSECGRMDQVCAYGRIPVFLTFDGDDMDVTELSPKKTIYVVIVDLKAGKDTRKILSDLNACFPNGKGEIGAGVRYALGKRNKEILFEARQAINEGDSKEVGRLMREAQRVFDKYVQPASPEELTAPKLHQVLEYPKIEPLIWGGKGVGSQGDGSAQFVARGEAEQEKLIEILEADLGVECFKLNIDAVPTERTVTYPESDGKPMAETDTHRDLMIDVIEMLKNYFTAHPDVYVSGNLLVYYEEGNPRKSVAPDVFVVVGVEKKRRRTYLLWEEGKPPDFVLEFVSPKTYKKDLGEKKDLYASVFGVREYYLFDPDGRYLQPALQGYRLVDGIYLPIQPVGDRLPSLVLGLELGEKDMELGLYNPETKNWLLKPAEEAEARKQAEAELGQLRALLEQLRSSDK